MPRAGVPITGAVLTWAREEGGFSQQSLAAALTVAPDVVSAWERGVTLPSAGQFTRLAQVLHRPTAIFFSPQPPRRAGIPTEFRNAPGLAGHELSPKEALQVRWGRSLQEIVSWALRDGGAPPVTMVDLSTRAASATAAAAFRQLLAVAPATQLAWTSPGEAFRAWRLALEGQGLLVLQLPMGKAGVRGFSVRDEYAPMIAVNTAYHPAARIFTLFHEVGHLLTRTDAACRLFVGPDEREIGVERWCERFAAEVLMPADAVRSTALSVGAPPGRPIADLATTQRLATRFKVSARAAALRLRELGMAPPGLYRDVVAKLGSLDWNPRGGGGGGRPASQSRLAQVGERIPEVLFRAAATGRITEADLADYLRLTTGQLEDVRSLVGTRA